MYLTVVNQHSIIVFFDYYYRTACTTAAETQSTTRSSFLNMTSSVKMDLKTKCTFISLVQSSRFHVFFHFLVDIGSQCTCVGNV